MWLGGNGGGYMMAVARFRVPPAQRRAFFAEGLAAVIVNPSWALGDGQAAAGGGSGGVAAAMALAATKPASTDERPSSEGDEAKFGLKIVEGEKRAGEFEEVGQAGGYDGTGADSRPSPNGGACREGVGRWRGEREGEVRVRRAVEDGGAAPACGRLTSAAVICLAGRRSRRMAAATRYT
ncbi:hypothetical protein NL676_034750 [Syzygium grande]|nr:hypothetical protein NL676_034750 [Syzygium grande]